MGLPPRAISLCLALSALSLAESTRNCPVCMDFEWFRLSKLLNMPSRLIADCDTFPMLTVPCERHCESLTAYFDDGGTTARHLSCYNFDFMNTLGEFPKYDWVQFHDLGKPQDFEASLYDDTVIIKGEYCDADDCFDHLCLTKDCITWKDDYVRYGVWGVAFLSFLATAYCISYLRRVKDDEVACVNAMDEIDRLLECGHPDVKRACSYIASQDIAEFNVTPRQVEYTPLSVDVSMGNSEMVSTSQFVEELQGNSNSQNGPKTSTPLLQPYVPSMKQYNDSAENKNLPGRLEKVYFTEEHVYYSTGSANNVQTEERNKMDMSNCDVFYEEYDVDLNAEPESKVEGDSMKNKVRGRREDSLADFGESELGVETVETDVALEENDTKQQKNAAKETTKVATSDECN